MTLGVWVTVTVSVVMELVLVAACVLAALHTRRTRHWDAFGLWAAGFGSMALAALIGAAKFGGMPVGWAHETAVLWATVAGAPLLFFGAVASAWRAVPMWALAAAAGVAFVASVLGIAPVMALVAMLGIVVVAGARLPRQPIASAAWIVAIGVAALRLVVSDPLAAALGIASDDVTHGLLAVSMLALAWGAARAKRPVDDVPKVTKPPDEVRVQAEPKQTLEIGVVEDV